MNEKNLLFIICLLFTFGCEEIAESPKTSGFESPEQIIQNPDIKKAKEASGIEIHYGENPPSLEGEYVTDGKVTNSSTELVKMRNLPINSTFHLFDQTIDGNISFTESIANIIVGGSGGFITGENGKFTIWGESVQTGEEAGLPDECEITVVLIMSGQKNTNGNLFASGLTVITEVKDYEEYEDLCGLWWMWEADFTMIDEQNSIDYEAKFSQLIPTIDGQINTTEWSNGNIYNIKFTRPDGAETKSGKLLLQHDGTWLYIGVNTEIKSGWDVYLSLKFDGNHDHKLTGNNSIPHVDINVEYPSPGGWSGYIRYVYLVGSDGYPITAPSGTLRKSYGSNTVSYEFKIKLSDLNTSAGQTVGFYTFNYNYPMTGIGLVYEYALANHGYEFPTNMVMNDPSKWAHVKLK